MTQLKIQYFNDETATWNDVAEILKSNLISHSDSYLNIFFPKPISSLRIFLSPNAGMNYLPGRVKIKLITLYGE